MVRRSPAGHYTRKAEILVDTGRITEAGKALVSARNALTPVSVKRRRAKAYTDLEQQIAALSVRVGLQESVVAEVVLKSEAEER